MFYKLKEEEVEKLREYNILDVRTTIINKLKELNFKITNIGYDYWIIAIEWYCKSHYRYSVRTIQMEDIYCYIAEFFNTTRSRVERNMRTMFTLNKKEIEKKYNYKNITNKKLLYLIGMEVYEELWKKK